MKLGACLSEASSTSACLAEQHRAPRSGWLVGFAFLRLFLATKKGLAPGETGWERSCQTTLKTKKHQTAANLSPNTSSPISAKILSIFSCAPAFAPPTRFAKINSFFIECSQPTSSVTVTW